MIKPKIVKWAFFIFATLFILVMPFYCHGQDTSPVCTKKYGDWRDSLIGLSTVTSIGSVSTNTQGKIVYVDEVGVIHLKSDTIPVMIMFSDTSFWSQAPMMWTKGYKIIDWTHNDSYLLDYHDNRMKPHYFIWLTKERK